MRYIPHTEQDIKQMLTDIGVQNVDELFESIPESLRLQNKILDLPPSLPGLDLLLVALPRMESEVHQLRALHHLLQQS